VSAYPVGTAAALGLAVCHTCGKASPADLHRCPRCDTAIHLRKPDSIQRTAALLVTAVVLLVPANMLPIMQTEHLGRVTPSTILGGVILLWEEASYPIALVILIASVVVPVAKILILSSLCWGVARASTAGPHDRARLYRATELVGRWSMIDVFVVAILVALIKLGGLLTIRPGAAALAFAGVVVTTILAAFAFDPRLIWDHARGEPDA
jgi:paraquat-inducible protein A